MCGIAGLLAAEIERLNVRSLVDPMQGKLTHRGPDDHGLFVSARNHCGLAHTRLSILDLSSAGHQPMGLIEPAVGDQKPEGRQGQRTRYWIVFNGEVYNYRDLREELEVNSLQGSERPRIHANSAWRSNTDTEVILRAYARWGRECVTRLRGMFAFAIWDEQEQELFLARDPLGVKPLYYYQTDGLFLFGSEIRALLASGVVSRKLSSDGLISYLQFGSVQDPFTIIDGVRSLLPGHSLTVRSLDKSLSYHESQYYNLKDSSIANLQVSQSRNLESCRKPKSREAGATELRQILEDSIRAHLVSDVPVAAFLSGGIDSSTIVALMSRVADQKPKTFSVVFNESQFSEAEHARVVAQKFGTDHQEILLAEEALLDLLPSALEAMDQPTMDGVNTYVVAKAVSDAGMKVAVSGLGGDELFAGYPSFRRALQLERLAIAPGVARRLASTAGRALTNGSARHRKIWDLVESDCSPYAAYSISRQLFSPSEISALIIGSVRREALGGRRSDATNPINATINSQFAIRNPQSDITDPSRLTPDGDIVNTISRYELTGYMANTLLRDTDQMSMAHGLEVRVPFVDKEVVDFVMALPGKWKISGRRPKPLLVDALGALLPEEIWSRPKMGFTLPFERWLRSSLQAELDETFSRDSLGQLGVDAKHARSIWQRFKKNPQHQPWSRPWALYVLAKWCELNDVAAQGVNGKASGVMREEVRRKSGEATQKSRCLEDGDGSGHGDL
jgi:asparagine synthase (glutamine-hydrolysing)